MIDKLKGHPEIGAIQPSLYTTNELKEINEKGVLPEEQGTDALNRTLEFTYGLEKTNTASKLSDNLYQKEISLLGTAQMVRSDMIRLSGMFDTRLFMYADEAYLGYRYSMTGLKMGMVTDVFFAHPPFAAIETPKVYSEYLIWRNYMFDAEYLYNIDDMGKRAVKNLFGPRNLFISNDDAVWRMVEESANENDILLIAVVKGMFDGVMGQYSPTVEGQNMDEKKQIATYSKEFEKMIDVNGILLRLINETDPYQSRLMIWGLNAADSKIHNIGQLDGIQRQKLIDTLKYYVSEWRDWVKTKHRDQSAITKIRNEFKNELLGKINVFTPSETLGHEQYLDRYSDKSNINDEAYMQVALNESRKAGIERWLFTACVGAVVVSGKGIIVGRGYNRMFSQFHAEHYAILDALSARVESLAEGKQKGIMRRRINEILRTANMPRAPDYYDNLDAAITALNRDLGGVLQNSPIYVTMHPCDKCTNLIMSLGMKRLVYGAEMPGGSLDNGKKLRNAGMETTGGVLARESRTVMTGYFLLKTYFSYIHELIQRLERQIISRRHSVLTANEMASLNKPVELSKTTGLNVTDENEKKPSTPIITTEPEEVLPIVRGRSWQDRISFISKIEQEGLVNNSLRMEYASTPQTKEAFKAVYNDLKNIINNSSVLRLNPADHTHFTIVNLPAFMSQEQLPESLFRNSVESTVMPALRQIPVTDFQLSGNIKITDSGAIIYEITDPETIEKITLIRNKFDNSWDKPNIVHMTIGNILDPGISPELLARIRDVVAIHNQKRTLDQRITVRNMKFEKSNYFGDIVYLSQDVPLAKPELKTNNLSEGRQGLEPQAGLSNDIVLEKADISLLNSPSLLSNSGYAKANKPSTEDYAKQLVGKKELILAANEGKEFRFVYEDMFFNKFKLTVYENETSNKIGFIDVRGNLIDFSFDKPYNGEAGPAIVVNNNYTQQYRGIGSALMLLSMAVAKNNGYKEFNVQYGSKAARFYESLGFVANKHIAGKFTYNFSEKKIGGILIETKTDIDNYNLGQLDSSQNTPEQYADNTDLASSLLQGLEPQSGLDDEILTASWSGNEKYITYFAHWIESPVLICALALAARLFVPVEYDTLVAALGPIAAYFAFRLPHLLRGAKIFNSKPVHKMSYYSLGLSVPVFALFIPGVSVIGYCLLGFMSFLSLIYLASEHFITNHNIENSDETFSSLFEALRYSYYEHKLEKYERQKMIYRRYNNEDKYIEIPITKYSLYPALGLISNIHSGQSEFERALILGIEKYALGLSGDYNKNRTDLDAIIKKFNDIACLDEYDDFKNPLFALRAMIKIGAALSGDNTLVKKIILPTFIAKAQDDTGYYANRLRACATEGLAELTPLIPNKDFKEKTVIPILIRNMLTPNTEIGRGEPLSRKEELWDLNRAGFESLYHLIKPTGRPIKITANDMYLINHSFGMKNLEKYYPVMIDIAEKAGQHAGLVLSRTVEWSGIQKDDTYETGKEKLTLFAEQYIELLIKFDKIEEKYLILDRKYVEQYIYSWQLLSLISGLSLADTFEAIVNKTGVEGLAILKYEQYLQAVREGITVPNKQFLIVLDELCVEFIAISKSENHDFFESDLFRFWPKNEINDDFVANLHYYQEIIGAIHNKNEYDLFVICDGLSLLMKQWGKQSFKEYLPEMKRILGSAGKNDMHVFRQLISLHEQLKTKQDLITYGNDLVDLGNRRRECKVSVRKFP